MNEEAVKLLHEVVRHTTRTGSTIGKTWKSVLQELR